MQALPPQAKLYRSTRVWSMYVDLVEALGTFEEARAVYDEMISLRVASAQVRASLVEALGTFAILETQSDSSYYDCVDEGFNASCEIGMRESSAPAVRTSAFDDNGCGCRWCSTTQTSCSSASIGRTRSRCTRRVRASVLICA